MSLTPEALKEYLQQPDGPHPVFIRSGEEALAAWTGLGDKPIVILRAPELRLSLCPNGQFNHNGTADCDDIVSIPETPMERRWVYLRDNGEISQNYFDIEKPLGTPSNGKFVQVEYRVIREEDTPPCK